MVDAPAPLWINKDPDTGLPQYNAQALRLADAVLLGNGTGRPLGSRSGIRAGSGSVSVSGSTVTVDPVLGVLDPAVTTTQGPYRFAEPDSTTFTLQAADSTNPRKDIVYVRVSDTDVDGSGLRKAEVLYSAGLAAQTPVAPALPARSLLLATLDVPQLNGGAASVTQANQFAVASGGVLPVRDLADVPADLADGSLACSFAGPGLWQKVGGSLRALDDDSGWQPIPDYTQYWSRGSGSQTPQVRRLGQWVFLSARWNRAVASWAAGSPEGVTAYVPDGYRPPVSVFLIASAYTGTCQVEIKPDGSIATSLPTVNVITGGRLWMSAMWPAS